MIEPNSTSPADSGNGGRPVRVVYAEELEQLRLQVELMGVRVDENLERMREVLATGSAVAAQAALRADDEIDAMMISLTERCYAVLALEAPVASDLRLVVSVVRVTGEFERIGDLALRIAKLAPEQHLLIADQRCHDILTVMADEAIDRYRCALRAWASQDLSLADQVATPSCSLELAQDQLTEQVLRLTGDDAVRIALRVTSAAKSLDRIADHTVVLGARLRYLVTGDPAHLSAEVR